MTRRPLDNYRLTDGFGWRTLPNGKRNNHLGQDYVGPSRAIVYPVKAGTVVETKANHPVYGNCVIINHGDVWSLTGHLASAPSVSTGQTVGETTWLGQQGNTGLSFGDHVHLGISTTRITVNNGGIQSGSMIDPERYLASNESLAALPGSETKGEEYPMLVLRNSVNGDCFMVSPKRIKHIGNMDDLNAAMAVFPYRDCTDRQFRVALIGLNIPYGLAVKNADWQG